MGGLESRIGTLRAQLDRAEAEAVELRKAKEEKEKENVELEKKMQGQGVELIEAQQKGLALRARMQSSIDKLSNQLSSVRSDLANNQNAHRRSRAELEDRERVEIEMKKSQEQLEQSVAKLRGQLTKREKECKLREEQQVALEQAYSAQKQKLVQAQQAEVSTRVAMEGLQAELAKVRGQYESAQKEAQTLRSSGDEEALSQVLAEKVAQQEAQMSGLEAQIGAMQAQLKQRSVEVKGLESKVD
eukprot:1769371-Rhodomonas_salina.1